MATINTYMLDVGKRVVATQAQVSLLALATFARAEKYAAPYKGRVMSETFRYETLDDGTVRGFVRVKFPGAAPPNGPDNQRKILRP